MKVGRLEGLRRKRKEGCGGKRKIPVGYAGGMMFQSFSLDDYF